MQGPEISGLLSKMVPAVPNPWERSAILLSTVEELYNLQAKEVVTSQIAPHPATISTRLAKAQVSYPKP